MSTSAYITTTYKTHPGSSVANPSQNLQPNSSPAQTTLSSGRLGQSHPTPQDGAAGNGATGHAPVKSDFEVVSAPSVEPSTFKPPIILLDNNKIDSTATPTKLVSLSTQQNPVTTVTASTTTVTASPPKPSMNPETPVTTTISPAELDGNQIDLKLSKDYRSSGDQAPNSLLGLANNIEGPREPNKSQPDSVSSLSGSSSAAPSSSPLLFNHKTQGYNQLAYLSATILLVLILIKISLCTDYVLVRQVAAI